MCRFSKPTYSVPNWSSFPIRSSNNTHLASSYPPVLLRTGWLARKFRDNLPALPERQAKNGHFTCFHSSTNFTPSPRKQHITPGQSVHPQSQFHSPNLLCLSAAEHLKINDHRRSFLVIWEIPGWMCTVSTVCHLGEGDNSVPTAFRYVFLYMLFLTCISVVE